MQISLFSDYVDRLMERRDELIELWGLCRDASYTDSQKLIVDSMFAPHVRSLDSEIETCYTYMDSKVILPS